MTMNERALPEVLADGRARIKAMALIHEKLYTSPDLARVDLADYLGSLTRYLFNVYKTNSDGVSLLLDVTQAWLDVDRAVPCGLIVNELVSNALKYAFADGRKGFICVRLADSGEGRLRISVIDNGVGFPPDFDFRRARSLGLQLAVRLTRQINGEIELASGEGTSFHITFARQVECPDH
jgi:two-component sensor histidine kinase